jgi:hypothetical protein
MFGQEAAEEPLRGLRVAISGAVPEREHWGEVRDLDRIVLRFISRLAGLVMKYGGEIVHGSHPSFTPLLVGEADRFSRTESGERRNLLTLVASDLFGEQPEVVETAGEGATVILTTRIGDGGVSHAATRSASLTALRIALVEEADVVVAVGGKLHKETGYNPGVLEELTFARWNSLPCFVVASFGGLAGALDENVVRLFGEGNELTAESSLEMARWHEDADEYAGVLFEHFVAHRRRFIQDTSRSRRRFLESDPRTGILRYQPRSIDAGLVHKAAGRFGEVRDALAQGDIANLEKLLRAPWWWGGSSTPDPSGTVPPITTPPRPRVRA